MRRKLQGSIFCIDKIHNIVQYIEGNVVLLLFHMAIVERGSSSLEIRWLGNLAIIVSSVGFTAKVIIMKGRG